MANKDINLSVGDLVDFPIEEIDQQVMDQMVESISHHAPADQSIEKIAKLRKEAIRMSALIISTQPNSRSRSLALTNVEQALMWAVKGVVLTDKSERDATEKAQ